MQNGVETPVLFNFLNPFTEVNGNKNTSFSMVRFYYCRQL